MDKRINRTIDNYLTTFKNDIKSFVETMDSEHIDTNKIIQYVFDYEKLCIDKEDFVKRKRQKNFILPEHRCCAKRANGLQCTRRRKNIDNPDSTSNAEDNLYCGTHIKATPHGTINTTQITQSSSQHKIELMPEDINGIIYYKDHNNKVYDIEHVLQLTKA